MTLTEAKAEIGKVLGVEAKAVWVERKSGDKRGRWWAWAEVNKPERYHRVSIEFSEQTRDTILALLIGAVKGAAKATSR